MKYSCTWDCYEVFFSVGCFRFCLHTDFFEHPQQLRGVCTSRASIIIGFTCMSHLHAAISKSAAVRSSGSSKSSFLLSYLSILPNLVQKNLEVKRKHSSKNKFWHNLCANLSWKLFNWPTQVSKWTLMRPHDTGYAEGWHNCVREP